MKKRFLFYKTITAPSLFYFVKELFFVLLISNANIAAQAYSLKGQMWGSLLRGNDPPIGISNYEESWGYIPTLSFERNLINNSVIDLEWAYKIGKVYSGDYSIGTLDAPYRIWFRYSSDRIEARLGLQKISFGPAMILRSLSWFDTIDIKDPTGQTDAVEAFRLRIFPNNSIGLWLWSINNDQDTLSFGGRTELSINAGELGFTYHTDQSTLPQSIGQPPVYISNAHQRIAFDYRYDGYIGFWFEVAGVLSNSKSNIRPNRFTLFTVGADYTIPIGPGILVMVENMNIREFSTVTDSIYTHNYTAFMASLPVNMLIQLMFITQVDWDNKNVYNFLRSSITYDHFSLNLILSSSPKRSDYDITEEYLPRTVSGFGVGIQLMLIYNH